jgi:hypothetical protein
LHPPLGGESRSMEFKMASQPPANLPLFYKN